MYTYVHKINNNGYFEDIQRCAYSGQCVETYGTPSFWHLGCLNYTEFLNYK